MCVMTKKIARIVAVDVVDDVRQTPIKGTDETIVVALVVPAFTPVHVVLPESHELGIVRQIGGKSKKLLRPSGFRGPQSDLVTRR